MILLKQINSNKNKMLIPGYLFFIGMLMGCDLSLDDRYHYVYSYRIHNQTESLISGILKLDPVYYKNPSIEFEIEAGKTIELLTKDGGDGSELTPYIDPATLLRFPAKELYVNTRGSHIIVDVESAEKWEYTTDRSTGIFTFSITEALLNP